MKKNSLFIVFLGVFFISSNLFAWKREGVKPSNASREKISSSASLENIVSGLVDIDKRISSLSDEERKFIIGYGHFRSRHWVDADRFFSDLILSLPLVADHIVYYRLVVANELEKYGEALSLSDELLSAYPDSVWIFDSKMEKAKSLMNLGRFSESMSVFADYIKRANADDAFEAKKFIAYCMIKEGMESQVVGFLKDLILNSGSEEKLNELEALISEVKSKFHVDLNKWISDPEQEYILAQSFISRSQWDEAVRRLEKIISHKDADKSLIVQVKWALAKCYRFLHKYDDAIALMEELQRDASVKGFSDDLLSTLATTYTKKNEYEKAIAIRQKMMNDARGNAAISAKMSYKIAFLYMDEGKYDEAIPLWQKANSIKSSSKQQIPARWYLAWCNYLAGHKEEAVKLFDSMLKTYGVRSNIYDRLQYWKARVLSELGRSSEAQNIFRKIINEHPNGYYGELSRRQLANDKRGAKDFVKINMSQFSVGARRAVPLQNPDHHEDSTHFAKAKFFNKLGLHEEAARELKRVFAPGRTEFTQTLMCLASKNYAHDIAYAMAEGRYRDVLSNSPGGNTDLERFVWNSAYPEAYEPVVLSLVSGNDIDPKLVWSIMRNESSFYPAAVSPAGAVGLLQLMPTTANRLAKEEGNTHIDRRDLYKPVANISLGILYLKKLSEMFPNNPVAWIASYNAGEEAVSRWIKNGKLNDIEKWIEEIPYDETNLYVKKVLTSYWKYQRLY